MDQGAKQITSGKDLSDFANVMRRLMEPASIEVTPGDLDDLDTLAETLPPRTRVYITSVAGKPVAASFEATRRVSALGMVPVPHIAARKITDRRELVALLTQLRALGVDEALVIAGDTPQPAGAFGGAIDLLRTGAFDDFSRIGVAGYPEGHPKISEQELFRALAEKAAFGRSSTTLLHVVTQFCFDPGTIIEWEHRIRRQGGVTLPIHVGLPGVTSVRKLLRYAAICGVGASAGFLRRNALSLGKLAATWKPDEMVSRVCAGVAGDPESTITQFHFFPFGGLQATAAWLRSARRGVQP